MKIKRIRQYCGKTFFRIPSRSWDSAPGSYGKIPVKHCSFSCGHKALVKFWNSPKERKRRSQRQRGAKNSHWKNGCRDVMGYVWVYHPKRHLHKIQEAIPRSILVMEQALGRRLTKAEVVHHINHNKKNDDIRNLMLFKNAAEHGRFHGKQKDMRPMWKGHKRYWDNRRKRK